MPIVIRSLDGSPVPEGLEEAIAALFGEGFGGFGAESPEVEPEQETASNETVTLNVSAVEAFANSVLALQASMDHMQEFASHLLSASENSAVMEHIRESTEGPEAPSEAVAEACEAAVNANRFDDALGHVARGYALAVYRTPWDQLSEETRLSIMEHVRNRA